MAGFRRKEASGVSEQSMDHLGHEEADLIRRACRGDRSASEALWSANRRWVAAIVLAHRPKHIDVEDLMQDVAIKFVGKVGTLRDEAAFRPWLRQIAVNACRGAARRAHPALGLVGGESPLPGEIAAPPDQHARGARDVGTRDMAERLYAQLMTLPSEYREPLLMRCLHEMSYQQIGAILDLPVTTIETRLARARRMLRSELGADATEESK
jgi:RNA polymerase sigma-70 factor (ECF subfamily)